MRGDPAPISNRRHGFVESSPICGPSGRGRIDPGALASQNSSRPAGRSDEIGAGLVGGHLGLVSPPAPLPRRGTDAGENRAAGLAVGSTRRMSISLPSGDLAAGASEFLHRPRPQRPGSIYLSRRHRFRRSCRCQAWLAEVIAMVSTPSSPSDERSQLPSNSCPVDLAGILAAFRTHGSGRGQNKLGRRSASRIAARRERLAVFPISIKGTRRAPVPARSPLKRRQPPISSLVSNLWGHGRLQRVEIS